MSRAADRIRIGAADVVRHARRTQWRHFYLGVAAAWLAPVVIGLTLDAYRPSTLRAGQVSIREQGAGGTRIYAQVRGLVSTLVACSPAIPVHLETEEGPVEVEKAGEAGGIRRVFEWSRIHGEGYSVPHIEEAHGWPLRWAVSRFEMPMMDEPVFLGSRRRALPAIFGARYQAYLRPMGAGNQLPSRVITVMTPGLSPKVMTHYSMPTSVHAANAMASLVVCAAVVGTALMCFTDVRMRLRARRSRCPCCGHEVVRPQDRCPECGVGVAWAGCDLA